MTTEVATEHKVQDVYTKTSSQQLKTGLQHKLFETFGCFCRVRCSLASKSDWVACNNGHCDYNNTALFVFPQAEETLKSKMALFFPSSDHRRQRGDIWAELNGKWVKTSFEGTHSQQSVESGVVDEWRATSLACSDLFCGEVCFAVMFPLREDDGENGVGPAAGLVHVGGSHGPVGQHVRAELKKKNTNDVDAAHPYQWLPLFLLPIILYL